MLFRKNDSEDKKTFLSKFMIIAVASFISISVSLCISFAWVSKNRNLDSGGLSFSLSPELLDAFSNDGKFILIDDGVETELVTQPNRAFLPGTSVDFYIGMYNKTQVTVKIGTFGLEIPTVWTTSSGTAYDKDSTAYDEVPIKDESGNYYYFGQNMKISVPEYSFYECEVENNTEIHLKTFISTDDVSSFVVPQTILPEDLSNIDRIKLLDVKELNQAAGIELFDISIPASTAVIFKIHLEFTDDNNQSIFMGFGSAESDIGGKCSRCVYATFEQSGD